MHNTYAIFWTQSRLNSVERIFHNRDSYNETELFSLVPNHGLFSGSSAVTIQVKVALWYRQANCHVSSRQIFTRPCIPPKIKNPFNIAESPWI